MPELTRKNIRSLLYYDPSCGLVFWRQQRGSIYQGDAAGFDDGRGYKSIRILGQQHPLHRIIWLYVYGVWPVAVDHINGDKKDNRLCNLKEADQATNMKNRARPRSNRSGIIGVFWNKSRCKWTAKIKVGGQNIHLGHFDSKDQAAEARKKAETRYGFAQTHGRSLASDNTIERRTGKSGYRGVTKHGPSWVARINTKDVSWRSGGHETPESAYEAWKEKAKEIGLI